MVNQELSALDTTQLAAQARTAYEQRRMRECLSLLNELRAADRDHPEVEALQSAMRRDMQQDLHDARALLDQSGTKEDKKKYRKAAELILLKILHLEPENVEAKILLQSARSSISPVAAPPQREPEPSPREEIPFVAAPPLFQRAAERKPKAKLPFILIAVLVAGVAGYFVVQSQPQNAVTFVPAPASPAETKPVAPLSADPAPVKAETPPVTVLADPQPTPATTKPVPQPRAASLLDSSVAGAQTGKLAVSSPVSADIYLNGRLIGSTPTTLELPVGRQTLEYRHGDLRTVVSHDIKPNATGSASVAFQINVQVNAKPWAQVFLEGSPQRQLGQTPLSGVVVPIGGVLVFEHPNFPPKTYRITEKDSAIQVDFP